MGTDNITKAIVEKTLECMSAELPLESDNKVDYAFEIRVDGQVVDVELTARYTSERFVSAEFLGAVDFGQRVELKSISDLWLGYNDGCYDEAAIEKEINTSLYFGVWVN